MRVAGARHARPRPRPRHMSARTAGNGSVSVATFVSVLRPRALRWQALGLCVILCTFGHFTDAYLVVWMSKDRTELWVFGGPVIEHWRGPAFRVQLSEGVRASPGWNVVRHSSWEIRPWPRIDDESGELWAWMLPKPTMIPLGAVMLIAVAAAIALWLLALRRADTQRITPESGACMECGYLLVGNTTSRCPECGASAVTTTYCEGCAGERAFPPLRVDVGGFRCASCGESFTSPGEPALVLYNAAVRRRGVAQVAFVCGALSMSLGCFGITLGPCAIGAGLVSLVKARRNPKWYGGASLARAGVVTGCIGMAIAIVVMWMS